MRQFRISAMATALAALVLAGPALAKPKPEAPAGCVWNKTPMGQGVLLSLICEQADKTFRVWIAKGNFTEDVMAGDPRAAYRLGSLLLKGAQGLPANEAEARRWLQKAAAGDKDAAALLASPKP